MGLFLPCWTAPTKGQLSVAVKGVRVPGIGTLIDIVCAWDQVIQVAKLSCSLPGTRGCKVLFSSLVLQELGQADTGHDGTFAIVFSKDILVFGVSIVVVMDRAFTLTCTVFSRSLMACWLKAWKAMVPPIKPSKERSAIFRSLRFFSGVIIIPFPFLYDSFYYLLLFIIYYFYLYFFNLTLRSKGQRKKTLQWSRAFGGKQKEAVIYRVLCCAYKCAVLCFPVKSCCAVLCCAFITC